MTRTNAREVAVLLCFEMQATGMTADDAIEALFDGEYYETLGKEHAAFAEKPDEKQSGYISEIVRGIASHSAELEGYIEKYSKDWKFGRISRTAVAIMKTAMYEVLYMPDVPNAAAVNEAVELAKRYEEESTVPFVNGLLGAFVRNEVV